MNTFQELVRRELESVEQKYKSINSLHEGYAVILEELDEFWEEVRKKPVLRRNDNIVQELVQVAAIAQRIAEDLIMV